MGNCLVLQEKKVIKIMSTDGEDFRYQSPKKIHQELSQLPGYTISDEPASTMAQHLDPMTDMQCGQLCDQKGPAAKAGNGAGVLRIKLVVSKQELKEILRKGGVSLDDMVTRLQREQSKGDENDKHRCRGWRPALQSIPEGKDFY